MKQFSSYWVIPSLISSLVVVSACKPRKNASDLQAAAGGCGDCCSIDPDMKEAEKTMESIREAARLRVFHMKEGFVNGNPLSMIIIAKMMRNKMMGGELYPTEKYLTEINRSSPNGKKLLKEGPGPVDQNIDEAVLKEVGDKFRDGLTQGSAELPGEKSVVATQANLIEVFGAGFEKVTDSAGRQIVIADIKDAMTYFLEAAGTNIDGQKSLYTEKHAKILLKSLVDSVVSGKMDYVSTDSSGAAKTRMPFSHDIDAQVGISYADAIYRKISRMSDGAASPAEISATKSLIKTYKDAMKDNSMELAEAAVKALETNDKAAVESLKKGEVMVNGKLAKVQFDVGFDRDAFIKTATEKGMIGKVREAFHPSSGKVK